MLGETQLRRKKKVSSNYRDGGGKPRADSDGISLNFVKTAGPGAFNIQPSPPPVRPGGLKTVFVRGAPPLPTRPSITRLSARPAVFRTDSIVLKLIRHAAFARVGFGLNAFPGHFFYRVTPLCALLVTPHPSIPPLTHICHSSSSMHHPLPTG